MSSRSAGRDPASITSMITPPDNPACGAELKSHWLLSIRSRETGSPYPYSVSSLILHTQAESGAYSRAHLLPPAFRDGVASPPSNVIDSVPTLSGHAVACQWRSSPSAESLAPRLGSRVSLRCYLLSQVITNHQRRNDVRPSFPSITSGHARESKPGDRIHDIVHDMIQLLYTSIPSPGTAVLMPARTVCVCVFFPFILDIKFVGRTSRGHTGGRSHRISHPPSFCGACLNFSREKDSAIAFPRRP